MLNMRLWFEQRQIIAGGIGQGLPQKVIAAMLSCDSARAGESWRESGWTRRSRVVGPDRHHTATEY